MSKYIREAAEGHKRSWAAKTGALLIPVLVVCGSVVPAQSGANGLPEASIEDLKLSLEVNGVPLKQVLDELSSRSGILFFSHGPALGDEISIKLENVPLGEGLKRLLHGYSYVVNPTDDSVTGDERRQGPRLEVHLLASGRSTAGTDAKAARKANVLNSKASRFTEGSRLSGRKGGIGEITLSTPAAEIDQESPEEVQEKQARALSEFMQRNINELRKTVKIASEEEDAEARDRVQDVVQNLVRQHLPEEATEGLLADFTDPEPAVRELAWENIRAVGPDALLESVQAALME